MQLDNTFAVTAPIDKVWDTLMGFEQVAGCVPGATAVALTDDSFDVTMRVKVGPILMQYKGTLEVVERDPATHRAVVRGKAQEVKGQGTAEGTMELRLHEEGDVTRGSCSAQVKLSGRAAAMGKGVIAKVADRLMGQFADNLQALLTGSPPRAEADDAAVDERSGDTVVEGVDTLAAGTRSQGVLRDPDESTPHTAPVEQVEGDRDMTAGRAAPGSAQPGVTDVPETRMPEAAVSGGAQSSPAARVTDRVSASGQTFGSPRRQPTEPHEPEALDGLGLVGGMVRDQLAQPRVLAGLLLPTALLIGFLVGRRSGRR